MLNCNLRIPTLFILFILSLSFCKITPINPSQPNILPSITKKIDKKVIKVIVLEISGPITPATTWYLNNKFEKCKNKDIDFYLITIDSEGGLLSSMTEIIKLFYNSNHPIITYVYPKGSRAASAAMFILIGGHVAVMSESTNTGASTPLVQDPTLQNKVIQDLLAFTRNLCQRRNKNYEAIKETITNSVSYTEKEALTKNIIDFIAKDPNEIFEKIKNKQINLDTQVAIKLVNFERIEYIKESTNMIEKFFLFISNPSIAYFLLTIGFWAIIIELNNPGLLVPLIVGIICLSLGLFGLGIISANILGIILVIFSFIVMLLELKFQSHGILFIVGLITFLLGSVMLFKKTDIYYPLPIGIITITTLMILLIFGYIIYSVFSVKKVQINFVSDTGKVVDIKGNSLVINVDGVLWEGIPINPNTTFEINEEVKIKKIEDLRLIIDKIDKKE